ncbi:Permease of the drug/metabolite transporter (DMT) superfamily [Thermomonospora echinospora]|uniref:Permease of the drug/metabolite transporter (DMT) superfamily n=1 Tax=Thermomonospora echinospora TaxID=1992 RepID=A0A1H6CRK7_9ACTN|nr:DMT family transporter [Thermomonospora echinospora]SEG75397.1 Permease of the drug/metabolite transporter (DMT) superfamily [Thermomonospora echinospora]
MSRRGWVLFALMSVIWGIPYLMIKVAVEGVSAPVLVFARTAVGAAVLLPLALHAHGPRELRDLLRRYWLPMLLFSVVEILAPWLLLADAERVLTSSMTGLLIAVSPVVSVLIVRLTGGAERLGAWQWAGLAVGFGGVTVLAAPELGGGDTWSIMEVLLTACGYALGTLITARWLKDVPALPMTALCLTFAALVYTPPAVMTWPDAVPSGRVLAALAGLALICTALAFLVFFALIREVGPSRALVFTYVNPAVAVLAGVLLLGEPLTVTIVVSFVLILGGSILAMTRRPDPDTTDPQPEPRAAAPEAAISATATSEHVDSENGGSEAVDSETR